MSSHVNRPPFNCHLTHDKLLTWSYAHISFQLSSNARKLLTWSYAHISFQLSSNARQATYVIIRPDLLSIVIEPSTCLLMSSHVNRPPFNCHLTHDKLLTWSYAQISFQLSSNTRKLLTWSYAHISFQLSSNARKLLTWSYDQISFQLSSNARHVYVTNVITRYTGPVQLSSKTR